MYNQDWKDNIGASLRKEIEENNKQIDTTLRLARIRLERAERYNPNLTMDEKVSIAPQLFGIWH